MIPVSNNIMCRVTPPILSICIPTFNRKVFLYQALQSIICQLNDKLAKMTEIVISDNASSDGTDKMIDDLRSAFQNHQIRYYRQSVNIGAVRNVCFLARSANGSFVYLMSDDDTMIPGALEKIIGMIQSQPNLDAICPGYCSLGDAFSESNISTIQNTECLIHYKDEALIRLGTMLTFISSVIFSKEVIAKVHVNNPENNFPHSFIFLESISQGNGCLFLTKPCVAARPNYSVSCDLIQVYVTDFVELLEYAKQIGYSSQATRTVLSKHAKWLVSNICQFRKTCYRPSLQKRIQDSKTIYKIWLYNPLALLCIEAAMWLPISFLDRLRFIFKSVRNSYIKGT